MRMHDPAMDLDHLWDAYDRSASFTKRARPRWREPITHAAATAAALAMAPSADAAIQYSGRQDIILTPTSAQPVTDASVDINGDLIDDFRFEIRLSNAAWVFTTQTQPTSGLGGAGVVTASLFPDRLSAGATVSAVTTAPNTALIGAAGANWAGGTMSFADAGFLGVGIRVANGTQTSLHYGWIRVGIETNAQGDPTAMTLYDWAWETDPDTEIAIGLIPEPTPASGLSLLAAGAAGLAAWRRRKRPAS